MPIESITLHCVRKDGRRETTELPGHTMSDARELAKWVLNHWNGVYSEVDICADDGTVETVRNPIRAISSWDGISFTSKMVF